MASDLQKKLDYILDEKINKIIPYNIRKGVDIFGVSGECVGVDSTDATATPGDIMYGKTAYVNDQKITGTIPDNDYLYYTPSTQNQSIPAGYTDGGTVWGDKNLIASNIKKDVEIFNIKGTYDSGVITADATASADEILSGETAYVNGEKITGTMPKLGNQTITPSTKDQRIGQGYLTSALIYGDSNLVADNIREGVEIFGVEGNFKPGIDTSDATATANDIMLNKIAYTYDGRVVGKHECLDTSDATASTDDILKDKTAYVDGEKITGTHECLDTSDATAAARDMAKGKTAYVNGQKIEGTAIDMSTDKGIVGYVGNSYGYCEDNPDEKTISAYTRFYNYDKLLRQDKYHGMNIYYSTLASIGKLTSDKIVAGNTIFGVDGSANMNLDTSDATATASNILSGKTAYVNGNKITGTMTNNSTVTVTPQGTTQTTKTINGYVGQVTVPSINQCLSEPVPTTISNYQTFTTQTTFSISTQRGFRVMAIISCYNIPTITSTGWELLTTQGIASSDGGAVLNTIFVFTKIAESDVETISIDSTRSDLNCIMLNYNSSYAPEIVYEYCSKGTTASTLYIPEALQKNDFIFATSRNSYAPSVGGVSANYCCGSGYLRLYQTTGVANAGSGYVYYGTSVYPYVLVLRFPETTPLDSDNIRSGVVIGGVKGTYTVDGDALASEIVQDKIAYVNGQKIIGTMPSYGDLTVEANDIDQVIEGGYADTITVKAADITSLYDYTVCYDIANKILDSQYEITPYREIEYIDFTGTQYLNLQYPLWNYTNWSIEFKVNFDYWYSYQHLLSIAEDDIIHETWIDGSGAWLIRMASGNKQTIANLTAGVDYTMRIEWNLGTCKCYLNGELKNTTNFGSFTSTNNVRFGQRSGAHFIGRLYYLKFWANDELKGDLIPALRISDDYPCAYDKQRNLFIENAEGDSLFEYGPLVKEASYEE